MPALLLILSFLLFASGSIIANRLDAPEYYEAYIWTDDEGNVREAPAQENGGYLRGAKRRAYELIYDLLPCGQLGQMSEILSEAAGDMGLSGENRSELLLFCGYSGLIILLSGGVGAGLFKRKDLK